MIHTFVDRFMANKDALRASFAASPPDAYADIVKAVVRIVGDEGDWTTPDPERVHEIDDGDFQGTLVYVIGATGYQPRDYWYVRVNYGSCSGCDTLEAIKYDGEEADKKLDGFMTLALHVVQGLKSMSDPAESL